MSRQAITVELPEDVYEQVKRAAKGMKRPLDLTLASIVKAATPSLEKVPIEFRSDLESMESLSDEKLLRIAENHVSPSQQRTFARLLRKNQSGELTGREQQSLTRLRNQADRLTLRKSYAYLLLKYRGHRIPSLSEIR